MNNESNSSSFLATILELVNGDSLVASYAYLHRMTTNCPMMNGTTMLLELVM